MYANSNSVIVDPKSFYGATKVCNEVIAESYYKNHNLNTCGLRLFSVYGPEGRPDMAYFKFAQNIIEEKPITLFNNGQMFRDFTYIDDVVKIVLNIAFDDSVDHFEAIDVGKGFPDSLMCLVKALENSLNIKALVVCEETYPKTDVLITKSCYNKYNMHFNFTPLQKGIDKFVTWYLNYRGGLYDEAIARNVNVS